MSTLKFLMVGALPALMVFWSCSDSATPPSPASPQIPSIENSADATRSAMLAVCCNQRFPATSELPGGDASIIWCPGGQDEEITCLDCAKLWAAYNPYEDSSLYGRACEQEIPDYVPPITWLSGSISNDHPSLTWNFVWSHFYVLKRKIGDGEWSTITTMANCSTGINNCPCNESYLDESISLSNESYNVYYNVYARMWDSYISPTAPQTVFKKTLAVSISGPTQLTTIQSGQFTANVSGGCPPYSYAWYKYQECQDRKLSDNIESIPCGEWRKLAATTQTFLQSGFIPGFQLKVIVTDQENDSAIDYHYVTVVLP